jgi:hypothetical protein
VNNQDIYCPNCNEPHKFTQKDGNDYCEGCGQKSEISLYHRYVYRESCFCGKEHIALSQEDGLAEYGAVVGIICTCGKIVEFHLPVN